MNLIEQRDKWRRAFELGYVPFNRILIDYREHRNDEMWRVSSQVEQLCEYILYLESEVQKND